MREKGFEERLLGLVGGAEAESFKALLGEKIERDKANKSYSLPYTVGVGSRHNGLTIGVRFGDLTISNWGKIGHFKHHKTLSLNLI